MATVEDDDEPESFAAALAGWGLTPAQVSETLEATDFGLGLVELGPAERGPNPGVAIVVDDRRDRELRDLFDWRERCPPEAYDAAWKVDGAPLVRVVLGPDEQALVRFAITISAPAQLERRYLFAVHAVAPLLAKLQVPGTGLWLIPSTVVEKQIARDGPGAVYDLADLCLRVGVTSRSIPSLDEALAHVGAPRQSAASPMNRAERRAAQRRAGHH